MFRYLAARNPEMRFCAIDTHAMVQRMDATSSRPPAWPNAPEHEPVPLRTIEAVERADEGRYDLPWVERLGFFVYALEADFIDAFAATFDAAARDDERYRGLLIAACRLGPHFEVQQLAEASGVPRGTISSWKSRRAWLATALDVIGRGPEVCLDAFSPARVTYFEDVVGLMGRWPIPRSQLVGPTEPETAEEAAVRGWLNSQLPERLHATGERQPVVAGAPVVLSETQADEVYRLADVHHAHRCEAPHKEGQG